jgi:hypothetical protein
MASQKYLILTSVMPLQKGFLQSSWLISLSKDGVFLLLFIVGQFKTFNYNSAWHQLEKFNKKELHL